MNLASSSGFLDPKCLQTFLSLAPHMVFIMGSELDKAHPRVSERQT